MVHYVVFVCACSFSPDEEPNILEVVEILEELDRCIVHTWVRDTHADHPGPARRTIVRRKFFYGQTAALFLGQALETVSMDVPTDWEGPRVVILVAPEGLFRERVLSAINECVVSTLIHVKSMDEFIRFADNMIDEEATGSESH